MSGKNMNIRLKNTKEPSCVVDNLKCSKNPWSEREKKTLLEALIKYGYADIGKISKEFPNKSKTAVKSMINKLRLAAEKCATKRESQIDVWLNSGFFNENDNVIPQALKYISLFENHPPSEKSAGCDFRVLYDILSRATQGLPPVDASHMTCETISYILNKITYEMLPAYENDICEYVDHLTRDRSKICYRPKRFL